MTGPSESLGPKGRILDGVAEAKVAESEVALAIVACKSLELNWLDGTRQARNPLRPPVETLFGCGGLARRSSC